MALAAGIAVLAFMRTAEADRYTLTATVDSDTDDPRPTPMAPSSTVTLEVAFVRDGGLTTKSFVPVLHMTWTEFDGTVHVDEQLGAPRIDMGDNGTGSQINIVGETTNSAGHLVRCGIVFLTATPLENIPFLQFGGFGGVKGTCFDLEVGFGNSDYVVHTIVDNDAAGGGGGVSASDLDDVEADLASLIGTTGGGASNNGLAGLVLAAQQSLSALSTANLDVAVSTRSTPGDVVAARNVLADAIVSTEGVVMGEIGMAQSDLEGAIAASENVVTNAIADSQHAVTDAIAAAQSSQEIALAAILGQVNLEIRMEIETALAIQAPFNVVLGRDNIGLVQTIVGNFLTSIGVSLTDPAQDTNQTAVNATNYYKAGVAALAQPSPSYKGAWANFGQAYLSGMKLVK